MKALFVHDTYYKRDEDGNVYAFGAFPYSLWHTRFLPHFEELTVIGREKKDAVDTDALDRSSGGHVTFRLFPNINSPLKRLFGAKPVVNSIYEEVQKADTVIIRGPVEFGMIAARAARKFGKPYAVEMSGCAFDHTWYHGSLTGKLYAPLKYMRARSMVSHADAVIYVTQNFLQKRYPARRLTEYASNVEIETPENKVLERRLTKIEQPRDKIVFGLIGNFGNGLKGLGIALKALGKIKSELPEFELLLLGQGDRQNWAPLIHRYGLEENVRFCGTLPGGRPVLEWLDGIDIYLQPSYHEGLPRAIIEAMSRGCPVLASNAGGTRELLPDRFIHEKGDDRTLAKAMKSLVTEKRENIQEIARTNFTKSLEYTQEKLMPKRIKFWKDFKKQAREKKL